MSLLEESGSIIGLSIVTSIIVVLLSNKGDALNKDIERDRRLLEECYGPLMNKIRKIKPQEVNPIADKLIMALVLKKEDLKSIEEIRDKFSHEFDDELKFYIFWLILNAESRAGDMSWVHKTPSGTSEIREFKNELFDLVKAKHDFHNNAIKTKREIKSSAWKQLLWSIIGYRWIFSE